MASRYVCRKVGCTNVTEVGEYYCESHKNDKKEKQSNYNRNRWTTDKKYLDFYKSTDWKKTRKVVLIRDEYECQHCHRNRDKDGIILDVHHIIPVKEDWYKRLSLYNLITLCRGCHELIERNPNLLKPKRNEKFNMDGI